MVQQNALKHTYQRDNEGHVEQAEYHYEASDSDGTFSGEIRLLSGRADWSACEYLVYAHAYGMPGLYGDDEYLRAFTSSFAASERMIMAMFEKATQVPPAETTKEYTPWVQTHII